MPNSTQLARTASLLHASVAFYRTLRDEQLSPDIFHTKPKRSETDFATKFLKNTPRKVRFSVSQWPDRRDTQKTVLSTRPTTCLVSAPSQLAWYAGFALGAYALDMSQVIASEC